MTEKTLRDEWAMKIYETWAHETEMMPDEKIKMAYALADEAMKVRDK